VGVRTVSIKKGYKAFDGGNKKSQMQTDSPGYHGQWLEETLFHEASHTSLDSRLENSAQWLNAQTLDGEFISTYARDNPNREDIAESCLPYFAMNNSRDRVAASTLAIFDATIPNRSVVLDTLDMKPVVKSDAYSWFDEGTQLLQVPGVRVGDVHYELSLRLTDLASLLFTVDAAAQTIAPSFNLLTNFANNALNIPLLVVAGKRYAVTFLLNNSDPVEFQLTSATEVN